MSGGGVTGTLTCATIQQPVKYQGGRQVNDTVSPQVIGNVIETESFRGFSLLLSILTITLPPPPSILLSVADSRKWKCATFKHVRAHFTVQRLCPICEQWHDQRGGERCFKPSPTVPNNSFLWLSLLRIPKMFIVFEMNRLSLMFAHLVAWGQRGEKLCHQAFLVDPDRKFMVWTETAFGRLAVPNGPWTQQKCSSGEFELLHCRVVEKRRYILTQMLTCSLIKYFIYCLNSPLLPHPPSPKSEDL